MTKTILLGGLGVIAETSEYHRVAFNLAFSELDLSISWTREEYQELLLTPGGLQRVSQYLLAHCPEKVSLAQTILILKNRFFIKLLESNPPTPRDGVNALIAYCKQTNTPIAIASTTGIANIRHVIKGCSISPNVFSAICSKEQVSAAKPDPEIYLHTCRVLGVNPYDCIAIEDSESGIESACRANIQCLAFLGENTKHHSIDNAISSIDSLYFVIDNLATFNNLSTEVRDRKSVV